MNSVNSESWTEAPVSVEVQSAAAQYLRATPNASFARLAEHLVYEKDLSVTARMVTRLLRAHRGRST